jgi:uncharacterized protein YjbI with pentapeptide repeats
MPYLDASHADLTGAIFVRADLKQACLHAVVDKQVNWNEANRKGARETDRELAKAEAWKPPRPVASP